MSDGGGVKIGTPAELQQAMGTDFCLSEQQWAAVSAPLEPAVVVAGAGSGKTTLMAARVFYLVATGQVEPHEVLGLTFTTKAAAGLASSITKALAAVEQLRPREDGEEKLEPTVSTYNAYAAQLLSEHGLRIGHEPDTRVMADASRYQLAERAMLQRTRPVTSGLSDSPTHVIKWLLELEGAMGEHLVSADDIRAFHARQRPRFEESIASSRAKKDLLAVLDKMDEREELLELVEDYRRLKAELGLMDFSDQIALAARLADDHPAVGLEERAKYRIVLLDEYQDTSVAQARMLSRLFSGDTPEAGRGHPVTAVGDPNQAIYGWRGASVSNILRFGDAFPLASGDSGVPTYPLTVNRRSDRRILDVANQLAQPLYDEFDQVQPLEPKPEAADGEIRVSVHETYAAELAWLPDQVLTAREQILAERGPDKPAWREIGVLTRDNATAADVFDALTAREIPVEIVGLSGLLRLPEVSEVVATMTLLHDLTANAELLTILTGPRWAIGPRDLAILGRRAGDLAHRRGRKEGLSLLEELQEAVSGADPTEILSLSDALADPGDGAEYPYSRQARERFELLAHELKWLRTHVGEPLLDLVRRIIDATGLDVELASSVSPAAAARRDNLDLFVKAVAEFQAIDGQVTLPALLAYLTAEDELGNGLDIATPTEADSVKLLTVHRAKGLEYDAVFLVGVCEEKFPNKQVRSQWTRGQWVLPAPLRGDAIDVPQLKGYEANDLKTLIEDARKHQAKEELRLGYVAFTRARHLLSVSSYLWHDSRLTPVAPSPYQCTAKEALESWGLEADSWLEKPEEGTPNPIQAGIASHPWPVTEHTAEALRRIDGAELVRAAMAGELGDDDLDLAEQARVDEWDRELERLLEEARRSRRTELAVPLPSSLSATALARVRDDPEAFARELARPMPRQPSPAARFGTRFHAWVEARFGQQDLFDPDELPGRGDVGIDDESDLKELIASFEQGEFAHRVPHAVEPPFALVLGGQVIRGRIDAVYADDDGSFLVVDWKTNKAETADPLQLALYRLAWAELHDVPLDKVRAAFHYVRTGRTVEYDDLPGRTELERLLPTAPG